MAALAKLLPLFLMGGANALSMGSLTSNPLMMMMLMGGSSRSFSNILPLMMLSGGSTGLNLSDPITLMAITSMSQPRRRYRRRGRSTANQLAYMRGQISMIRGGN